MIKLEEYLLKSLSKNTVKIYIYEIDKYILSNLNSEFYRYIEVMNYIKKLRKTKKPQTINRILCSIKRYYDYLLEIKKREDNPARNIFLVDSKKDDFIQLQDLFTEQELLKLLIPRKERYPILTLRNQIVISILVHQGLLISELCNLRISDLDLEKGTLKIMGTTKTNPRILALESTQILLFYKYLEQDRPILLSYKKDKSTDLGYFLLNKKGNFLKIEDVDYLVSTYKNIFKKPLNSMKIRQSVLYNKLNSGENLRLVQHFAGHKNADSTEKYKEIGIKALQNAINQYHPIN